MFNKVAKPLFLLVIGVSIFLISATSVGAASHFKDVDKNNPHYKGINYLSKKDVINGYKNGTFKPGASIDRSNAALMFTKALDLPKSKYEAYTFFDVDKNTMYADEIMATYKEGIFTGDKGNNFNDGPLTREQMATVLVNAFNLQDTGVSVDVNLGNVDPSHKNNVRILAKNGITNQLKDFRPSETVTRGQFSTFMNKSMAIDYVENMIGAGTYKVGKDISEGEYLVYPKNNSYGSYIEGFSDSTSESIIFNDFIREGDHSYVTISDGQYFKLEDATMYPVDHAPSVKPENGIYTNGMFKVGEDIDPGKYKVRLNEDADDEGFLQVDSDNFRAIDSTVTNEFVKNETYITVKDGQYLTLEGLKIRN